MKILIVEDDDISMQYIVELVKDSGIEIIKAVNSKEAVQKLISKKDIDLVLLDI